MDDNGVHYPISSVELKNTIRCFSLSKSLVMSKLVYDPQKVAKDAFYIDNMRERDKHFLLTAEKHIQIAKMYDIQRASTMQKKQQRIVHKLA
ncbi:hypothetical protein [Bartonella bilalgolemii]|uniref:Uncharacterized protein n=1 Tax=Bartonella bilalgolemii TaxID=2942911 RepID=A0ABT0P8L1_9HYPH|nr:hypothetical protein [Bartonella sp. G70]MCL6229806.1 hypothetical protein [Bartonella sp. G70]